MTRLWVYAHGLFGCALVLAMWCVDKVSQAVLFLCCGCVCHTLFEATSETDHSETHVEIQGSCLKIRVSKTLKQVEKEKVEQSLEAAKAEAVDPCDSEIWRLNRTPKTLATRQTNHHLVGTL